MKIRYKRIIAAVLIVVLLAGGWVFWETWKVHTAEPVIRIDYRARLSELSRAAQPPGENAWPLLMEAITTYDEVVLEVQQRKIGDRGEKSEDDGSPDFLLIRHPSFNPNDLQRERTALRLLEERGLFDDLKQAAAMPTAFQDFRDIQDLHMDRDRQTRRLRAIAQVLAARMRLAADEQQSASTVDSFEQLLAIARFASYQPGTISYLIGESTRAIAFAELVRTLHKHRLDEPTCVALLQAIDRQNTFGSLSIAIEGQKIGQLHHIQETHSDDGSGDGYLIPRAFDRAARRHVISSAPPKEPTIAEAFRARFQYSNRAEVVEAVSEAYDLLAEHARQPAHLRAQCPLKPGEVALPDIEPWSESLAIIIQGYPDLAEATLVGDVHLAGLPLLVAIEAFEARHDRLPDSLDDLMPTFLPDLPIDPVNQSTFGSKLPVDDPFERSYLVYSFGLDGFDDGGKSYEPTEKSRSRSEPLCDLSMQGFDFVLNHPQMLGFP